MVRDTICRAAVLNSSRFFQEKAIDTLPVVPEGKEVMYGYFDDENGLAMGVDDKGAFVLTRVNNIETKYRNKED